MGSEQSSLPPKKPGQRAPPVRRGHTIAATSVPEPPRSSDPPASGNNSPGASVCSDSELPYISYTVDRPIGDSPKTSSRHQRSDKRSLLPRRQLSAPTRRLARGRDIVVVAPGGERELNEDVQRLQEIPTFLPIMRGALGLPGARDPEVLEGLDGRPLARACARVQAHVAACAQPLAALQRGLTARVKDADVEISKLYSQMVSLQRGNARHAERLSRVHEVGNQLARCGSLLNQTLQDIEELNAMLPPDKQLEPFVWNNER